MNKTNRKSNYDKYPYTSIEGNIEVGWKKILEKLSCLLKEVRLLTIDMYVGINEQEIKENIEKRKHELIIDTRTLLKTEKKIREMTQKIVKDDDLLGDTKILEGR